MNAIDAIRLTIDHAHEWFQGTIADLTQEQADFVPPGKAHPIGETVAHVIQSEDSILNGMIRGKPTLWESEGWGERLRIPDVTMHTEEQARQFRCDLEALRPYQEAVYASVAEFLDSATEADLAREVQSAIGPMTVADGLTNALVGNTLVHTGEISALKGVQGAKGYPM